MFGQVRYCKMFTYMVYLLSVSITKVQFELNRAHFYINNIAKLIFDISVNFVFQIGRDDHLCMGHVSLPISNYESQFLLQFL